MTKFKTGYLSDSSKSRRQKQPITMANKCFQYRTSLFLSVWSLNKHQNMHFHSKKTIYTLYSHYSYNVYIRKGLNVCIIILILKFADHTHSVIMFLFSLFPVLNYCPFNGLSITSGSSLSDHHFWDKPNAGNL